MTTKLLLLAAFVCSMLLMSFNYNKRKKRILFFGDSLTEFGLYKNGYISQIAAMLMQEEKDKMYDLIGAGISGNKVTDLLKRLNKDVLAKGPDVVVIFIGINDIWHKQSIGKGTNETEFETVYNELVSRLEEKKIKVIVCTPTVINERIDDTNSFNDELNIYSDIIRRIADKNELPLIDLRKIFIEYLQEYNLDNAETGVLTTDGVHLNFVGNKLVAEEMWKVIEPLTEQLIA